MKEKAVSDAKEKFTSLSSCSPVTLGDSNLKISSFFEFLDFLLLWKMKQMREGCGLFTLAERVSGVCKDSARLWWDPHSPLDIWDA